MTRDPLAEALAGHPLFAAIHREGTLQRAARELASEELHEGVWVLEEDATEQEQPLRLAAAGADARTYSGGVWRLTLERGTAMTATQTEGPSGLTLLVGDARFPVEAHRPVQLPLSEFPDALAAIDARGRRIVLVG